MNKPECEAVLDKLLEWKAVPVSCLNKSKKELKNAPEKFLKDFAESPLKELLDARALVSEDMWAAYKWMQLNGLQEQIIFYNARRKMNDWFKARYPRPAKGIPNVDAQTDGANDMIAEWNAAQRV
jgi:hypothetical protein